MAAHKMNIIPFVCLTLIYLHVTHLHGYSVVPYPQESNSISYNSHGGSGSRYPSGLGAYPLANDTYNYGPYPPTPLVNKPIYSGPNKPGYPNSPSANYYSQYNPAVLYISPPYAGQPGSNPPPPSTLYDDQTSDPPKSGFWNLFSFITWPKTWLFGSSDTPATPVPVNQFAFFRNRPPYYNQPLNYPTPPAPGSYHSDGQQPPVKHQQGLYQVSPPNSRYPYAPQPGKYPFGSNYQDNPKPYYPTSKPPPTNLPYPSTPKTVYGVPKPAPVGENKNTYDTPQPTYSIYLVPSKPIFTAPSSSYDYVAPPQPHYPSPYRMPLRPYYHNPAPVYDDFGYPQRNPYYPPAPVYPTYPAPKPDCCGEPVPVPIVPKIPAGGVETINAESVNSAVIAGPKGDDNSVKIAGPKEDVSSTTTTVTTTTVQPVSSTGGAPSDSTPAPQTGAVKPQARHLFSGENGAKGWVPLHTV